MPVGVLMATNGLKNPPFYNQQLNVLAAGYFSSADGLFSVFGSSTLLMLLAFENRVIS